MDRCAAPLLLALLVIGAAGCASSSRGTRSALERTTAQRLRAEVGRWQGTPYCYGGSSRRCIDCSGFVKTVYADVFDLMLPRTTHQQVRTGKPIDRDELQAGDLVFFHTTSDTRHVGIYLSHGRFAHASTSNGVTISSLNSDYWRRHYWTARRLLSEFPSMAKKPIAQAEPAPPVPIADDHTNLPRLGW